MKHLVLTTLLIATASPIALAQSTLPRNDVYALATQPETRVVDGVCHVTGALWSEESNGPVAHEQLLLVQQSNRRITHTATTDAQGIYTIAIPVDRSTVFREEVKATYSRTGTLIRVNTPGPFATCANATVMLGKIESLTP